MWSFFPGKEGSQWFWIVSWNSYQKGDGECFTFRFCTKLLIPKTFDGCDTKLAWWWKFSATSHTQALLLQESLHHFIADFSATKELVWMCVRSVYLCAAVQTDGTEQAGKRSKCEVLSSVTQQKLFFSGSHVSFHLFPLEPARSKEHSQMLNLAGSCRSLTHLC